MICNPEDLGFVMQDLFGQQEDVFRPVKQPTTHDYNARFRRHKRKKRVAKHR